MGETCTDKRKKRPNRLEKKETQPEILLLLSNILFPESNEKGILFRGSLII